MPTAAISGDSLKAVKQHQSVAADSLHPVGRDSLLSLPSPLGVWPDTRSTEAPQTSRELKYLQEQSRSLAFYGKKSIRPETPTKYVTGRLGSHLLHPQNAQVIPRQAFTGGWEATVLLTAVFLLALLRFHYQKRLSAFWDAFWVKRFGLQLMREENVQGQRTSWFLNLVFVLSVSSFLYAAFSPFQPIFLPASPGFQYLFLSFLVLCAYGVKWLVFKISGLVLNTEREVDEYLFQIFITNQIAGIFFLTLVIVLEFQRVFPRAYIIHTGAILALLLFLFRSARGFGMALASARVRGVYIFLYFCTLEIVPLLWIVKVLSNMGFKIL